MTRHAITFICSEILSSATLGKYISFYEEEEMYISIGINLVIQVNSDIISASFEYVRMYEIVICKVETKIHIP